MKNKLMVGLMTLVVGASVFAAGHNFVDSNGDKTCDTYVSRGYKTAYEAGEQGSEQYRSGESERGKRHNTQGKHRNRKEAPGRGKNRS